MSTLVNVRIKEIKGKDLIIGIDQIHPDASLNFKLCNKDLETTALILLVDLLGRTNKKRAYLLKKFPGIPIMSFPDFDEIDLIDKAEITHIIKSDAWENGYFNGMSSDEIR